MIAGSMFLLFSLSFFLANYFPLIFLYFYLAVVTGFYGLADGPVTLGIRFEGALFFLNLALILVLVLKSKLVSGCYMSKKIIFIFIVTLLHGMLVSVFFFNSPIFEAINTGKDFFSLLLLPYILLKKRITSHVLTHTVVSCSVILTSILLIYYSFGLHPVGYKVISGNDLGLHIRFDTLVFLGFTILCYLKLYTNSRLTRFTIMDWSLFVFLFIGSILVAHLSVNIAAFFVVICSILFKQAHINKHLKLVLRFLFLLAFAFPATYFIFNDTINSTINQILYLDGAFGSRFSANVLRMNYMSEQLFLGYGFLGENSSISNYITAISSTRFNSTLFTADFGFLDLTLRFGVIGVICFVVFGVRLLNSFKDEEKLYAIFVIISFITMSFTWSPFTNIFGIVPIVIMLGVLMKRQQEKELVQKIIN